RRVVDIGDRGPGLVIQLVVGDQLARGAFSGADVINDQVHLVGGLIQTGDGRKRLVIQSVVGEDLTGGSAARAQVTGDDLQVSDRVVQIIIKRGIVNELPGRTLAR